MWHGLTDENPAHRPPSPPADPLRVLIIGAGSRGTAYSRAIVESTNAVVHAIAEPIKFKREKLGLDSIWKGSQGSPRRGQEFSDWRDFLSYEEDRRKRVEAGDQDVEPGVDAALVCTLDEQHAEIVVGLAPFRLHVLCEKPLATTLQDCWNIYSALQNNSSTSIFSIGHVLRYSPHNGQLRELMLQDRAVGDIISVEHTEPVGFWHFSHSYVRGNWRREDTTAPSLLTKSCHDIDLLLWLLASPPQADSNEPPHLPSTVFSSGHLSYFHRLRKPRAAGSATNCLSCQIEQGCTYSAKRVYVDRQLAQGKTGWQVKIVDPEIEDCYRVLGLDAAKGKLLQTLEEDYSNDASDDTIRKRPWFGRCVWESDNDVCDDQTVIMQWDDDLVYHRCLSQHNDTDHRPRYSKTATFHMIAHTEAQCERRGVVYGTEGEITYDSHMIKVFTFATGETKTYHPKQMPGGHGGGDDGLIRQFVKAAEAVKHDEMDVDKAQKRYIGCTMEDVLRSHAMVFAAEESRVGKKVVHWDKWWSGKMTALQHAKSPSSMDGSKDSEKDWDVVSPQPGSEDSSS